MKTSDLSLQTLVGMLGLSLMSAACIINGGSDDGSDGSATDSGNPPPTTGTPSDTGDTGDTAETGSDTGNEVCEGSENILSDPSFEMGTPSDAWLESSLIFESPICDENCTEEEGAAPHSGDWWVWFGGLDDMAEEAAVEQVMVVPAGDTAQLSFWFQIRSGSGTGEDVFAVDIIDGETVDTVFMATDFDMPDFAGGYTRVDLDISDWADGGSYQLRFSASIAGNGLTSFFLDDVEIVSCGEGSTGTAGSDTVGVDTTAGNDTTAGDSDSGTSGSGSSSDSGGSTGGGGSSSGS